MNLLRQTKEIRFYQLYLLIVLLIVSCGGVESANPNLIQIAPSPPSSQPVEYGASLGEWAEATQAESSDGPLAVEANELTGYPALDQIQTGSANASYPAPELEENSPDSGDLLASVAEDAGGATATVEPPPPTFFTFDDVVYQQIMWDALVPANFTAEAIMAKYEGQLAQITDGSSGAAEIYEQMQEEFNNAPINRTMDGASVRLAGFIAPLEYTGDLITEFLLVPYFGACIHVPPPPANQTVFVKMAEGQGIKFEEAYYPFWVMGELTAQDTSTHLAEAGYYIENAVLELYTDSP